MIAGLVLLLIQVKCREGNQGYNPFCPCRVVCFSWSQGARQTIQVRARNGEPRFSWEPGLSFCQKLVDGGKRNDLDVEWSGGLAASTPTYLPRQISQSGTLADKLYP
jgi:hypothetical protein